MGPGHETSYCSTEQGPQSELRWELYPSLSCQQIPMCFLHPEGLEMSCADHRQQHSFCPAVWPWENRVIQNHLPLGSFPRPGSPLQNSLQLDGFLLDILPFLLTVPPDTSDSVGHCIYLRASLRKHIASTHACHPVTGYISATLVQAFPTMSVNLLLPQPSPSKAP